MKPNFCNAIGIAKNASPENHVTEMQIDFSINYTDTSTQLTEQGPVTVSARKADPVASVLLARDGVVSLIDVLRKVLGEEFDEIVEYLESRD